MTALTGRPHRGSNTRVTVQVLIQDRDVKTGEWKARHITNYHGVTHHVNVNANNLWPKELTLLDTLISACVKFNKGDTTRG